MSRFDKKIEELKLLLPPPATPAGSYRPVIFSGHLAFISGQVSKDADGKVLSGKVGRDLTLEAGAQAAELAALNVVSVIKHLIGFNRFSRMVRLTGYVQSDPGFYEIPKVLNGASDLLVRIFGEEGTHARSAVGVAALPMNAAVELETIVELKKSRL